MTDKSENKPITNELIEEHLIKIEARLDKQAQDNVSTFWVGIAAFCASLTVAGAAVAATAFITLSGSACSMFAFGLVLVVAGVITFTFACILAKRH